MKLLSFENRTRGRKSPDAWLGFGKRDDGHYLLLRLPLFVRDTRRDEASRRYLHGWFNPVFLFFFCRGEISVVWFMEFFGTFMDESPYVDDGGLTITFSASCQQFADACKSLQKSIGEIMVPSFSGMGKILSRGVFTSGELRAAEMQAMQELMLEAGGEK